MVNSYYKELYNDLLIYLYKQIKNMEVTIAVITVPSHVAQETADLVVGAGIKAIWNFTNVKLKLPEGISCQQEDLTSGYAMLSLMMNNDD